jgi:hypothetical protein
MATRFPVQPPGRVSTALQIEIRFSSGDPIVLSVPDAFESLAMKWSYIARSRERWRQSDDDPAQGAGNPLHKILSEDEVRRIATERLVEVVVPFDVQREEFAWALRIFPWEYALSAITRGLRTGPLTVVRLLDDGSGRRSSEKATVSLVKPAIVQSAPAGLARWYNTEVEGDLMLTSLGLPPNKALRLSNPTRESLRGWLNANSPTLVHAAGCDNHQAVALMKSATPDGAVLDGYALQGLDDGKLDLVPSEDLAKLLTAGQAKPDLVMLNFYNSAPRIAARTVAHGAKFAIGYHDVIDDSVAAVFSATLYRKLQETDGNLLAAFQSALNEVRAQPSKFRGACIVLWSSVSLLAPSKASASKRRSQGVYQQMGATEAWRQIRVVCEPVDRVNYSLLHNKKSLFRNFQIYRNNVQGEIREIEVRVTLNTGESSVPFVQSLVLAEDQTVVDLSAQVVVPLTSSLIRRQSERVQSSVTVEVTCSGQRTLLETHRIGLCPVDEWQDGQAEEWGWLPSFVLPRDPAVPLIIDSAQALLSTLADDPGVGFDGYQSVDTTSTDPEQRYAAVDRQVQAIWHAILNHHGLSYINPPPSYGSATQRLRTPTQVVGEKRGTCIELALLLASCLEYIDIYPVLFLLTGHAFVGYWRGEDLYQRFLAFKDIEPGLADRSETSMAVTAASKLPGYILDQSQHLEVRQRVFERQIVPLEATWLAMRGGFESAAEEGRKNLRLRREFQAMIDVRLARDRDVTPLPMLGAQP